MTTQNNLRQYAATADSTSSNLGKEVQSKDWLTRSDQLFLVVMSGLILVTLVVRTFLLSAGGGETVEVDQIAERAYVFEIDINRATWVEWMQLDGVGEVMGRRLVADREEHGPFKSVDDVQRVKGIGSAILEKIRKHLACENCEQD